MAWCRCTCDFSIVALCLSHIGLMSMLDARSRSPCLKNSSMIRSTQWRYKSNGFVGLDKSAQWTMFWRTWKWNLWSQSRVSSKATYLNAICVVVQQEDSRAGHFLGFYHGLQVCKQTHVLWHVSGQNLKLNLMSRPRKQWKHVGLPCQ